MRQPWLAMAFVAVVGADVVLRPRASLATGNWRAAEEQRLRAHFDSVDRELRATPTVTLSAAQRSARAQLVEWLREYRDAGDFPVNEDFPERPTPYFRDRHGNLCAMAYLLARSGRGEVVDAVAESRNNARVHDLADMPALTAWLDSVGMSVDEAARIQPQYGSPHPVGARREASVGYTVSSVVASGAAVVTAALNAVDPSGTSGWAGVVTGAAVTILGAAQWSAESDNRTVARWDVGVGIATLALSARGFRAARREDASRPAGMGERASWRLQPIVETSAQRSPRVGLRASRRF